MKNIQHFLLYNQLILIKKTKLFKKIIKSSNLWNSQKIP